MVTYLIFAAKINLILLGFIVENNSDILLTNLCFTGITSIFAPAVKIRSRKTNAPEIRTYYHVSIVKKAEISL